MHNYENKAVLKRLFVWFWVLVWFFFFTSPKTFIHKIHLHTKFKIQNTYKIHFMLVWEPV